MSKIYGKLNKQNLITRDNRGNLGDCYNIKKYEKLKIHTHNILFRSCHIKTIMQPLVTGSHTLLPIFPTV